MELQPAAASALIVVIVLGSLALVLLGRSRKRSRRGDHTQREAALRPVRFLAFEDVTAFGEDLAALDVEIAGHVLDPGATADYQRALDIYEQAKDAGESVSVPDDVTHLASIIADGRYAIACVRARVAGQPLPTRRPPCFFDPRHGPSVVDVAFEPPGGVRRGVPACALDAERLRAGAEPNTRTVLVNGSRVPYWEGGRAFQPYAMGYFGVDALSWLFIGSLLLDSPVAHLEPETSGHDDAWSGDDQGRDQASGQGGDAGGFDFGDF